MPQIMSLDSETGVKAVYYYYNLPDSKQFPCQAVARDNICGERYNKPDSSLFLGQYRRENGALLTQQQAILRSDSTPGRISVMRNRAAVVVCPHAGPRI